MSLKDKVQAAKFAYRDVPICLDGSLVFEREQGLAKVAAAQAAVHAASVALQRYEEPEGADTRLSMKSAGRVELEDALAAAQAEADRAREAVDAVETRMRDSEVTFRFTAMPKDEFESLRIAAKGDSTVLYSKLARATGQYLNDDGELEPIGTDVWDMLEPNMTAGQWALIVDALDQINIIEGKRGLAFLRRGSQTTQN